MSIENHAHVPVLKNEVLQLLKPEWHGIVLVDCTLGSGGHSKALSADFDSSDLLIGIDRDIEAIRFNERLFAEVPFQVSLHHRRFDEVADVLDEVGVRDADRFLFDLGFSSTQVNKAERGFSFMKEGPLDMRMNQSDPVSAAEIVNNWSEKDLAGIFKIYGEERFSRKIAGNIVRRREESPIETTQELADIIIQAIPAKYRNQEGIHPATRVFQAIRIAVNDELDLLRKGLRAALSRLGPGGRMGVLSYQSLEHRIVKELFREYCGWSDQPLGPEIYAPKQVPRGRMITKKPVKPCAAEVQINPRSRSAQLRVLERNMEG